MRTHVRRRHSSPKVSFALISFGIASLAIAIASACGREGTGSTTEPEPEPVTRATTTVASVDVTALSSTPAAVVTNYGRTLIVGGLGSVPVARDANQFVVAINAGEQPNGLVLSTGSSGGGTLRIDPRSTLLAFASNFPGVATNDPTVLRERLSEIAAEQCWSYIEGIAAQRVGSGESLEQLVSDEEFLASITACIQPLVQRRDNLRIFGPAVTTVRTATAASSTLIADAVGGGVRIQASREPGSTQLRVVLTNTMHRRVAVYAQESNCTGGNTTAPRLVTPVLEGLDGLSDWGDFVSMNPNLPQIEDKGLPTQAQKCIDYWIVGPGLKPGDAPPAGVPSRIEKNDERSFITYVVLPVVLKIVPEVAKETVSKPFAAGLEIGLSIGLIDKLLSSSGTARWAAVISLAAVVIGALSLFAGVVGTVTGGILAIPLAVSVGTYAGELIEANATTRVRIVQPATGGGEVAPVISEYSWDTAPIANQDFSGTITGSSFVVGATQVWFCESGSGVCYQHPSQGIVVTSGNRIRVTNAKMHAGSWQISAQTAAGQSNRSTSFTVASLPAPAAVSVSPSTGSWTTSPQDVSVGSTRATRIWYTIRTTSDGSTPADPPEPSSALNDGSIVGASGTFQVLANAGENKRLRVRFRGENGVGYGAASAAYAYAIDRRAAPGAVSVSPSTGSWTTSPQDVSVSSTAATRIWYTIRTTTDGSTPADPPEPSSALNDGSIVGASGTFQVLANAGENKRLRVRFRGENGVGYGAASAAYAYAIDRRAAPGPVSVSPSTGSWTTSPQDVSVGSTGATRIWFTIRTTTDGSTPADPPEPTSSLNDGSISGSSGTFQIFANAGENKRLKVKFRGENGVGYGATSSVYSYAIDRRAAPGAVSVNPASGSWTTSPQDVSVGSSSATRIWYTIRATTDGSTPADPPEPSSSLNDGSISGSSGTFQVFANAGENKRLKVKFRGENGVGYGATSSVYSYAIDRRVAPGAVSVNPASGSWTTSPHDVSVGSTGATRIWYTIRTTTDGSTPVDPPEPTSSLNDGSISGSSGTFQVFANAGENKRLKVKFRGENGVGYGATSSVYSYAIDRRVAPGAVSVNPASGSWTTSPQDVSVGSSNATRIWYTIRTTTDGSTPADPPEPSSALNDGSIAGASGIFQVFANAGQNKRLKVRFGARTVWATARRAPCTPMPSTAASVVPPKYRALSAER